MAMSERVEFVGGAGAVLAARLDRAEGAERGVALFAHCFSCSKDLAAARRISQALQARGITVLRFDFTGLGHSEGDFANTNFSTNLDDLVAAADWLRTRHSAPTLLVGHSLGGAAVIAAAARIPEARAVATIAAPSEASHVAGLLESSRETIEREGEAEVSLAGRPFTIKRQFLEDIEEGRVREAAARLKRALLILHAPTDQTVGVENATELFVAAKHPKSFVSLAGADHLLTDPKDSLYAGEVIAAWAGRYALAAPQEDRAAPSQAAPSQAAYDGPGVRVSETGEGGYANLVETGRHRLKADEPVQLGGLDTGPGPYEYLAAALGACTSMTLRMYAQRKGWELGRIAVTVEHAKQDGADVFRRTLEVEGELTAEQHDKLIEIAGKCPVHRTLERSSRIETRLADGL